MDAESWVWLIRAYKSTIIIKVTGADKQADGSYKVNMENVKSGKVESLDADVIMVCVGRRPYTETLGLETCGIEVNERGQVPVDDNFQAIFMVSFS